MTEVVNLSMIREIMALPGMPFTPTYDLNTRTLHFFVDLDHKWLADDPDLALRLDDLEPLRYEPIELNKKPVYVLRNLITDVEGVGKREIRTRVPMENAVFVCDLCVIDYIRRVLVLNSAKPVDCCPKRLK